MMKRKTEERKHSWQEQLHEEFLRNNDKFCREKNIEISQKFFF